MKLAYFVLPHFGGTYTVFKNLRLGLAAFDVDLQWLGVCDQNYTLPNAMKQEAEFGLLVAVKSGSSGEECGQQVAEAIRDNGFDGIIINVLGDQVQTNIARYLPDNILRLMVVHNITPGTYAAAKAIRDHVHATVCVAERARTDLVDHYGFPKARTHTIFNGVDLSTFRDQPHRMRSTSSPLRLLFVGRIEDSSKGVFWLREIIDALPETIKLTIVGDGPDMGKLQRRLVPYKSRVVFEGAVPGTDVAGYMATHDVLVMPSRFEGFPMTLLEAMAAGCVPVVSEIKGVTDTIVREGQNGVLFPVGDYTAASRAVVQLNSERNLLNCMSAAARETVSMHYSIDGMAQRYHDVLKTLKLFSPMLAPPFEMESWRLPPGLRPGLRTYIPLPLKNWLRVMRERI
ncbi:glycosyltransferase family 1 protein [Pseudorhizobium endolithicum]|uniref:Glycosyltransferase family 1 protein n=1 Tax=Pseudorhizobium endolithicum TaxID=1191678 RepID=A0ABM8PRE0_9HYPH|nr:glycosyltransferase family 4 protein [Pseudorhizobium endolithicum]CAD7044355.1 glycosyltransferase family 1 protein [Pseudorhizobium endolithicum]